MPIIRVTQGEIPSSPWTGRFDHAHGQVLLRRIGWTGIALDVLINEDCVSIRVHCHKTGRPRGILIRFAL